MNCKAVITDLDRTLLRSDKTLSTYTAEVLRKTKEKGIKIIAATARPKRSIKEYDDAVGFDVLVCLNGAETACGNRFTNRCIPKSVGESLLSKVCGTGEYVISVESDGVLYANAVFPQWESVFYTSFPRLPAGNLHKIIFSYSESVLEIIQKALPSELYCTVANKQLIQIMHLSATKWNGICDVLDSLNIDPSETIYFGDDNDDIEPIRRCGLGIAVENAIPDVKNAADLIIASNDTDSVAVFLEQILNSENIRL